MNLTHWEVIPRQPHLPSEAYQHRVFNKSVIATHENPCKNVILRQMVPKNREKYKPEPFTRPQDRSSCRQSKSRLFSRRFE